MIKTLYQPFRKWSERGSVWIISDTHFDDPDCQLMDKNWITPEQHIKNLKCVSKNDFVIHLGDVGNPEYLEEIKKLNPNAEYLKVGDELKIQYREKINEK